jgi:hypothetical protein
MATKKLAKVAKRGWSLKKFSEAVARGAGRKTFKPAEKKHIEKCYDDNVTVRDTVATLGG